MRPWAKWALGLTVVAVGVAALRVTIAMFRVEGVAPRAAVALHGADAFGDPLPEGAVARIGTIRWRADGPAVWAPDGEHLLAGGWDEEILAIDAKTGLVDWTLPGHAGRVAMNLQLRYVEQIVRTGELPTVIDGLAELHVMPDGRLLSAGQSLRVWNLATRVEEKRFPIRGDTWPCAVSPDGKRAACSWNTFVRVIDLASGGRVVRVPTEDRPTCVAWDRDGTRVIAGLPDGRIAIGKLVEKPPVFVKVSDARIVAVLVPGDGRDVWVLDAKGGVAIVALDDPDAPPRRPSSGDAASAAVVPCWMTASPDGRTVAISQLDGPMRCFDAATSSPVPAPIQERGFSAVGWSPDGKRFAAARGNTIRVVGAGTDPQADAPISDVNAVAFSPDGRSIALYDFHGSVGVADVATGAIRARFDAREWGGHLAWTPDGTTVVVGMRGPRVAAFDAATGAASWSLDPDPISGGLGHSARIAGDASCAAWLGTDAVVRILDLRGDRARATDVPTATNGAWSGLALSAAARRVALLQEVPDAENPQRTHTTLRVWNVGARTPCAEIRVVGHGNLALSADGRRAAVAGEQRADVYDLEASPPSRTSASWSVRERRWSQGATPAFSSDGTLLAVGDADGVVRVFAVPSCAEIATLRGHRAGVESLAFSPDGTRLVSGSADTTALVWDLTKLPAAPSASPAPK